MFRSVAAPGENCQDVIATLILSSFPNFIFDSIATRFEELGIVCLLVS